MQTTINISLDVPQTYQLDALRQELTEYAKKLVAKAKPAQWKSTGDVFFVS